MRATYIEGDALHRNDRQGMKGAIADAATQGNNHFSHVSVDANLLDELAHVFAEFSEKGTGRTRHYVHDEIEAGLCGRPAGTFTDWEELDPTVELLFLRGSARCGRHQVRSVVRLRRPQGRTRRTK